MVATQDTPDPQDKYAFLSGQIENLASSLGSNGFVSSAVVPSADRLMLYWFGSVPQQVTQLISKSGLLVVITSVPYSLTAIDDAARKLAADPAVAGAGLGKDFKSLRVRILKGTPLAVKTRLSQSVRVATDATAPDIPVQIDTDQAERTIDAANRQVDSSPFKGGATIKSELGYVCSSGFAAVINGQSTRGIVTTAHCPGTNWHNSDGNLGYGTKFVGSPFRKNDPADAMVLTGGSSYGPYIYRNGPTGTATLKVGYWSSPPVGWFVATDGALSGEASGIVVYATEEFENIDGIVRGPGFWTDYNVDGIAPYGQGDSGSVAFRAIGSGNGTYLAQLTGILSGVSNQLPCRGFLNGPDGNPRFCGKQGFYIKIATVLAGLQVTPATS